MKNKNKYLEMMRPKGNAEDGYAISNQFDRVFVQQVVSHNKGNIEEMMGLWIDKNIDRDKRAIVHGVIPPKLIKIWVDEQLFFI